MALESLLVCPGACSYSTLRESKFQVEISQSKPSHGDCALRLSWGHGSVTAVRPHHQCLLVQPSAGTSHRWNSIGHLSLALGFSGSTLWEEQGCGVYPLGPLSAQCHRIFIFIKNVGCVCVCLQLWRCHQISWSWSCYTQHWATLRECWGPSLSLLNEQQSLFTLESSLWPHRILKAFIFKTNF